MRGLLLLTVVLLAGAALAQEEQFPSPMVEHTRAHPRLKQETPPGRREKLDVGTLFLPEGLKRESPLPLLVHFHGGTWLPEAAAARTGTAVIVVQLGSGSTVYARPFAETGRLLGLLQEAETRAGVKFEPVTLSAWSAGYGAVREILKQPEAYDRAHALLLLDALHAGYVNGKPGPRESQLVTGQLDPFVHFARDAVDGKKRMLVTHTEIFPGTFASTTETADHLLRELGLQRRAVLQWGPMQTQQLSEVRKGKFLLQGFAGNSAPDHVDQLHGLPEFLKRLNE